MKRIVVPAPVEIEGLSEPLFTFEKFCESAFHIDQRVGQSAGNLRRAIKVLGIVKGKAPGDEVLLEDEHYRQLKSAALEPKGANGMGWNPRVAMHCEAFFDAVEYAEDHDPNAKKQDDDAPSDAGDGGSDGG